MCERGADLEFQIDDVDETDRTKSRSLTEVAR
jgi:hypothetical protein